eukprot:8556329-Pyramimonas_sp.AAC.1
MTKDRVDARLTTNSESYHSNALAVEDMRMADYAGEGIRVVALLNEVVSSMGTQRLGGMLSGYYGLLCAATPARWPVRLPNKRAWPLYERI